MPVHNALDARGVILSILAAGALPLAGCARKPAPEAPSSVVIVEDEQRPEWKNIAREKDIARLEGLPALWQEALSLITTRAGERTLANGGDLLRPDAALEKPEPTPGRYQCRVWRLPSGPRAARGFITYRPFTCFIGFEGPLLLFTKEEGSDRPAGRIWPGTETHLVFLGAMALGKEEQVAAYGDDPDRNLAGIIERVDAFRWRLVMPAPVPASRLDVIELIPLALPIDPPGS